MPDFIFRWKPVNIVCSLLGGTCSRYSNRFCNQFNHITNLLIYHSTHSWNIKSSNITLSETKLFTDLIIQLQVEWQAALHMLFYSWWWWTGILGNLSSGWGLKTFCSEGASPKAGSRKTTQALICLGRYLGSTTKTPPPCRGWKVFCINSLLIADR